MRTLRLVALSDDGTSLILAEDGADGESERFDAAHRRPPARGRPR